MKPTTTGVAVFSGLAAVVAADALPMDSIPLQCVKVCGPIVELTSICNTNIDARRRALKRRKVDGVAAGVRGPRLHYSRTRENECNGGRCAKEKKAVDPEKRQFSVIRQAPTSFPPELIALPEETVAARPTRIFLSIETTSAVPTSANPPPPPTDDTNTNDGNADDDVDPEDDAEDDAPAPSTTIATIDQTATAIADASATSTGAAVGADAESDAEEWWMPDDAEEQCVCMNDSFDVGRLTALCASCVDQTGDPTNSTFPLILLLLPRYWRNTNVHFAQISTSSSQRADSRTRPTLANWTAPQRTYASRPRSRRCR